MPQTVTIGSVMTPTPHSIERSATIAAAKHMMQDLGVRHLPVLADETLLSIITDRDINLAIAANKGMRAAEEISVDEVCALDAYMVDAATPLEEVVTFMALRHIGSALVTESDQLAGIFTATDACRLLGVCLRGEPVAD